MTKKLLGLSLVFVLAVLVMTGCGKKDQVEETAPVQEVVPVSSAYVVDVAQTTVGWAGEMNIIGKKHNGQIAVKSGSLNVADGQIISGEVIMDMTTIADEDLTDEKEKTKLEDHLKSSDFFDVENYGEAKFVITGAEPIVDGEVNQYNVTADLTIKDKTNSVTFPAMITMVDNQLIASGELTIDRTLWDIRWGSDKFFDDLGDKILSDEIKFTLNVKADMQADTVTTQEDLTVTEDGEVVEENENVEVNVEVE